MLVPAKFLSPFRIGGLFFLAILQTAPWGEVGGVRPDYLLAVIVVMALTAPDRTSWLSLLVLGLVDDLLSGSNLGTMALFFLLSGSGVAFFSSRMIAHTIPAVGATMAVVSVLKTFYMFVIRSVVADLPDVAFFPEGFGLFLILQVLTAVVLWVAAGRWPFLRRLLWGKDHGL